MKKKNVLLILMLVSLVVWGCGNGDQADNNSGNDGTDSSSESGGSGGSGGSGDDGSGGSGDDGSGGSGDDGSGGSGGSNVSSGGGGDDCAAVAWNVNVEPLNILLLLDRSESMITTTDKNSYAEMVQQAIDNIVKQNSSTGLTNFSLNVFPSATSCTNDYRLENKTTPLMNVVCDAPKLVDSNGEVEQPLVPFSDDDVTVDTYNEVKDVLDTVGQCGGTPICSTLKWARKYLNSLNIKGKTYVLLATDGAPNCNHGLNSNIDACINSETGEKQADFPENCLDDTCAYNEAHRLAADGYRTFVIGVGKEVARFSSVLDTIAYWGGNSDGNETSYDDIGDAPGGGSWYYPAVDNNSISKAFEDVVNKAIKCTYKVKWDDIPDYDTDSKRDVEHKCSAVNVQGEIFGSKNNNVDITYMSNCSKEKDDLVGWTWADKDIKGYSWKKIEDLDTDVSKCKTVRLCPKACGMLKVHDGERLWKKITAKFGCSPDVFID